MKKNWSGTNVFCNVPRTRGKEIGAKLKAIFAQEDREACQKKAEEVAQFLRDNKMKSAAITVESGIKEALTYTNYPHEHWLKILSNNGIERINRKIRRRTNAVGAFLDGNSALILVCTRLRFVSSSEWGVKTISTRNACMNRSVNESLKRQVLPPDLHQP